HQTIDGFGFCEAFQRANAIINLPEPARTEVLDLLFHPINGAGFSILRIGLGSSPDSRGDHMNSPQPNASSVFAWDGKDSGQVWIAKKAQEYGVMTFIADAWSAPGYMKTNGRDGDGGWLCGVRGEGQGPECKGVSWVKGYAEYLASYVKVWVEEAKVPIRYLGFLNEPNLVKNYATMLSDGYQAADMMPAMREALNANGLEKVGVSCCEGQGWSMQRQLLAEMQEVGAEKGLAMVSTHTYKGDPPKPDGPFNTSHPVWVTEISPIMDRLRFNADVWYRNHTENEGLLNAINIHEALTTGNVSAYIYWIGADETPTPTEGPAKPLYTISPTYWSSAHYSRFIRPGALRFEVEQGYFLEENRVDSPLLLTGFRNPDNSIIVQVINNGDEELAVSLHPAMRNRWSRTGNTCELSTWVSDNGR
ncbi:glycoside hydrolase superfamily, partial [Immersiella caudata]